MNTARAVLPREAPTGMDLDPVLPLLGEALVDGVIGLEQTRIIVATMKGLPARVDPQTRDLVQKTLVEAGITTEPEPFAEFARMIALTCDPDGTLDEPNPTDKVELTLGTRNPVTGLTRFTGRLDDYGVEVLGQATDGLAAPQPGVDGTPDPRSAATRRGQALIEALHRYLDVGDLPTQGGERPHITLTMDYADLQRAVGAATLEHGGPISAGQARMLACDAKIIPAVLGSRSQVLDVGAAARLFPTAVRRAITLRDKGCVWPGCDRPAGWCDAHHVRHWADGGPTITGQRRAPVPPASLRNPHRALADPLGHRRHPRVGATDMGRPTTGPATQHRTPHHHPAPDMRSPGNSKARPRRRALRSVRTRRIVSPGQRRRIMAGVAGLRAAQSTDPMISRSAADFSVVQAVAEPPRPSRPRTDWCSCASTY